jgi:hypothetical protein
LVVLLAGINLVNPRSQLQGDCFNDSIRNNRSYSSTLAPRCKMKKFLGNDILIAGVSALRLNVN